MIKWEYHDYRPEGFECYEAKWNKLYSLAAARIGENRYTIWWYYKGMTQIKEHIDATSWEEAKSTAISIVKDYYNRQAIYWRDMKIAFANWTEEI